MRFTGLNASALPTSAGARIFAEQIRKEFDHPLIGEIEIAIHGDRSTATRVAKTVAQLSKRTGLATIFPVGLEHSPRLWQVNLNPRNPVFSDKTKGFVNRLRHMDAPLTVAGETASYMDVMATLNSDLPYALLILVAALLLFVFLATRSVVLPIKMLIMNVLSLSGALGLLVVIFQDGHLQGVLGFRSQNALVVALPIIVGAGAFGLLTDYGLFLVMRIKEAREEGHPDREAIAQGIERTGRIITAAALLFSIAVGALAASGILLIKEGAIGIVTAVLLDAFVVRPLLAPSLMAILGRWNWWPRDMAMLGDVDAAQNSVPARHR
jgi:uncharacterized membrane protein YdfJ with MMPL/SSD domain